MIYPGNMTKKKAQISHLFRPFNLIIITATMYLLKYGLMHPIMRMLSKMVNLEMVSQIEPFPFAMLVAGVVLIAAGGYILNDIKDVKTDEINNTGNPVGKLISVEKANLLYQITTGLGLALSFWVAFEIGNYNYGIIQLTAAISLWFYSNYFKTEFLSGNLVVAFVVALVPLTVGIYEVSLVQIAYFNKVTDFKDFNFNFLAFWFLGYSVFVFVLTLIREIEKDMEDATGDQQIGANTLPIVLGSRVAKLVVTFLYTAVVVGLYWVRLHFLTDPISGTIILTILFVIILNLFQLWSGKKLLMRVSSWSKVLSLIGVLFLFALKYIIDNELFFNV